MSLHTLKSFLELSFNKMLQAHLLQGMFWYFFVGRTPTDSSIEYDFGYVEKKN